MKVKDLIEQLKCFNPNANISLKTSEDITLSYICENGHTPTTTLQVFIEPSDFCYSCVWFDDGTCIMYGKECEMVEECFQYCEE